jgi:hypothetical protein
LAGCTLASTSADRASRTAPPPDGGRAADSRIVARTAPMISLSRTGRPLTNRYCPSALARVREGAAAKPSTTTPSRSNHPDGAAAEIASQISPSRVSRRRRRAGLRPSDGRAFLAGQREGDVAAPAREAAHHLRIASASVRSVLRNFSAPASHRIDR